MLRKDPKGGYKSHPAGFFSKKRLWRFYSGSDHTKGESEEEEYQAIMQQQKHTPVVTMYDEATKKCWWMFTDEVWCENEGYTQDEMRALILDKWERWRPAFWPRRRLTLPSVWPLRVRYWGIRNRIRHPSSLSGFKARD